MADLPIARTTLILLALNGTLGLALQAQALPTPLPNAPGRQIEQTGQASLGGAVVDPDHSKVAGAQVTVKDTATKVTHTVTTDSDGRFGFPALEPGQFTLTIRSAGFAPWSSSGILLTPGEEYEMPPVQLQIATATAQVDVTFTQYDMAQEQLHEQEQQRIFAIFPNFYVTYNWKAAPLTPGQKFKLSLRASSDPGFFLQTAAIAGIEQWQNTYEGYGQGAQGYFKRFGASSADGFTAAMIGGAILPSLLHQDPRYFYKGTGTIRSRVLYAISTVVICKGDNGKWQPNYSNVLGNLASAGISNAYYPASDRHGARVTIDNALIGTASGAFSSLMQEFVLRKFTPHHKP
ncbi:carboxypeptidase regulatory-like domain-containing protein [Granulicella sp. WH15]|uniref:carboxypeptidase-like regulatory domain-containing protein n=1 Tax=Granulicella sp. WH15 TaxID=2602070 RepID=UPI00136710B5|nr:carboxypeptidase-like regulatory domain-containing protein [Granulicella sp. WH15]QHN04466.1 carboxypeptidase regulatory-like domain-containing protein [Granulicella sp. WH15]